MSGAGDAVRFPVAFSGSVVIGRDPGCDLVLLDKSVSRRHATLRRDVNGSWRITDHRSKNGTFVNGARVNGSSPVVPGDHLMLGLVGVTLAEIGDDFTIGPTEHNPIRSITPLTSREQAIIRLVALGDTDQQIADTLIISVRTVQAHLDNIKNKTQLRRRPDLTRYALREGLVSASEMSSQ